MTIELNPIVRRFAERSPLPVMARAVLERVRIQPPGIDNIVKPVKSG